MTSVYVKLSIASADGLMNFTVSITIAFALNSFILTDRPRAPTMDAMKFRVPIKF